MNSDQTLINKIVELEKTAEKTVIAPTKTVNGITIIQTKSKVTVEGEGHKVIHVSFMK